MTLSGKAYIVEFQAPWPERGEHNPVWLSRLATPWEALREALEGQLLYDPAAKCLHWNIRETPTYKNDESARVALKETL